MKILITRHDKIGDFVTMLPLVQAIKKQTNYEIIMLISPINIPLAKELGFIDGVIEYREDRKSLLQEIKSHKFDVSISGFIDTNLGKLLFLSRIPKRIAPATKIAQIFFTKRVKQRRSRVEKREFEYNLDLIKALDNRLEINFNIPLLKLDKKRENIVIFHIGFGGSSDGNLCFNEYLILAKRASVYSDVVFTFGPDDDKAKEYIKSNIDFNIRIKDNFRDIFEFTEFIASSSLFISTSTGPMHLAGVTNTPTMSFFGDTIFASSSRWATISDKSLQHNFNKPFDFDNIEKQLINFLKDN